MSQLDSNLIKSWYSQAAYSGDPNDASGAPLLGNKLSFVAQRMSLWRSLYSLLSMGPTDLENWTLGVREVEMTVSC